MIDPSGVEVTALPTSSLTSELRQQVGHLFHASYRDANDRYLEKSLRAFAHVGLATVHGHVIGFALGDTRLRDVPRVGTCPVSLAGIACIDPQWRRRGLFATVATAALHGSGETVFPGVHLAAGRVAHAASYRSFVLPSAVPRPGVPLSPWQKEVGAFIAAAYGATQFDEDHFVCVGDGAGPGEPELEIEAATPDVQRLFEFVNRARGDALLVVGWFPSAPVGW